SSLFFFSSRRRHTSFSRDWSSDVCSSDLFYLVFQSLILDLFGLGAIVGLLIALWNRYVIRPRRLTHGVWSDGFILVSLLVIMVTGFLVEGLRIVATQDPWAAWSPVGTATGRLLA